MTKLSDQIMADRRADYPMGLIAARNACSGSYVRVVVRNNTTYEARAARDPKKLEERRIEALVEDRGKMRLARLAYAQGGVDMVAHDLGVSPATARAIVFKLINGNTPPGPWKKGSER